MTNCPDERKVTALEDECVKELLRDCPPEGGNCEFETLEKLVRAAFRGGVDAAIQSRSVR